MKAQDINRLARKKKNKRGKKKNKAVVLRTQRIKKNVFFFIPLQRKLAVVLRTQQALKKYI